MANQLFFPEDEVLVVMSKGKELEFFDFEGNKSDRYLEKEQLHGSLFGSSP